MTVSRRLCARLTAVFLFCFVVAAEAGITGTITVNSDADGTPADDGACTLREAVLLAHGIEPPETAGECVKVFPDPKAAREQHIKGLGPFFVETVIDFVPALAGGTIDLNIEEVPPKGLEANAGFFGPTALFVTTTIAIVGDADDGIIIQRGAGAPEMRLFAVVSEDLLFNGPLKGFAPAALALENVTLSNGLARGGDGGDGGFEQLEAAVAKGASGPVALGGGGGGGDGGDGGFEQLEAAVAKGASGPVALGGGGGGGAGGLGGAALNVGGVLALNNSTLDNNQAIGGNAGANGMGNPVKGSSASAGGGGGGGLGGDGGNGGAGTAGSGGGTGGGEFPGDDGFIGGGGAGGGEFTSGGDGGFLGGGGGGGSITAELFDKGGFSISTSASGAGGQIGGGGGGIPTSSEALKGESGGVGGFGAGEGTPLGGGGGAGLGGAVFNYAGVVVSLNSTFSGNAAIGGTGFALPAPKGTFGDPDGAGHGGGIFNAGGLVGINNSSFSDNRADQGGGAVFNLTADVGCILDKGDCDCEGETEAHNSVFANTLNGASDVEADAIDGCSRIGVQGDNLLIEMPPPMGTKGGGGSNIITEEDPLLGPLGDNGGPSNTHLPLPGSPVIDAVIPPAPKGDGAAAAKGFIDLEDCSDRDQRGVSRNQLAACDMGSVEVLPGTIQICKQEDPAPAGKTLGWSFEGDLGPFGLNHGQCTKASVLAPDVYTVTELSNEPFFYLGAINCQSDGASSSFSVDLPNRSVAITLAEDENVVCTFVNEQAGTVIIGKNTDVPTAESFGFNDDIPVPPPVKASEKGPGPDFTVPSGGAIAFPFTRPGSYTVSEVDPFPLNFALASVACDDANSGQSGPLSATINLEPGEVVECTFFNEELGADLSVDKQVLDPPDMPTLGDLLTYQVTVSNAGPGFATNVVVTDPLPPQLAFSSSGCATESPPGTVRWEVGTLNAGAAQACTVVLEIVDFGEIFNTALVVGDQGDPGNGNEGVVLIRGASFPVPALGPWSLWLLALAVGAVAAGTLHRRKP